MKLIISTLLVFSFSAISHADVLTDCELEAPIESTVTNIFDLWPQGSDISKKLIIKTEDEQGNEDSIELSVFNEIRDSDGTLGSPGRPSDFLYGMWGTNSQAKPLAVWLAYPGERVTSYYTPSEYIKEVKQVDGRTFYRFGNKSQYVCRGENCILGDHYQYIDLLFEGSKIVGIEVVTSKLAEAGGHAVWKQFPYCVRKAHLDRISEWKYND